MRKNPTMSNQTNLTDARNNLADICAQVVADRKDSRVKIVQLSLPPEFYSPKSLTKNHH
jgi:hypothetical protein